MKKDFWNIFHETFAGKRKKRYLRVTIYQYISGLTGFDGEMKWYVSMRSLVG